MTSIGFVGVGRLGAPLALSLVAAGFELVVHDRDEDAARRVAAAGARAVATSAQAARGSDVLITCLPSPGAVADAVAADGGALETMTPGAVWIDMSANDRHELVKLAAQAESCGGATLEAPVTGGVHLAARGELTIIDDGALGSASDLEVITNMLAFVHLAACGEALMLAKRAGLDLAQAYEVIAASSGTSFVHETEGQVILNGSYDIGFTLDLALKDLGLARDLGAATGVPLDLAERVHSRFAEARERYGGSAWSPTVVKLLEDEVGEDLRAPGFPEALT